MKKRLIWNFEINPNPLLQIPSMESSKQNALHWESRFFWPGDRIITLHGLDETCLNLSNYQIKHKQDTYYLLPQGNYNIKARQEQLQYKPLLIETATALAYGKKINLQEEHDAPLPGAEDFTAQTLIAQINLHGEKKQVEKETLTYLLATSPKIKLELARLNIVNNTYFSVSIESRAQHCVAAIAQQLLREQLPQDYVSFLRSRV